MASPSPLRRSSRHQNNECISEHTNTLNILAKHEEHDVSKSNVCNKGGNNNSISPIKSNNVSPMINGSKLNQLDNGRVIQSDANVNSETKPVNDAPPGNALSNIGRLLRSAAKSSPSVKPVNDTPGRVLNSYPEIELDNDSLQSNPSLNKGGIIQSKTNTKLEIESVTPGKSLIGSGRFLRSKAESSPVCKPVNDILEIKPVSYISPGNHSLDSERVLRSRTKSNSETKHFNDTPPGNSVIVESNTEIKPLNNTPLERGRKKGKAPDNEYSPIFRGVKHLLTWMRCRQNLVNAYSSEIWQGQSTEKVRPEKEIDQAKSDILKYKLQIRELFQRLDSALSEGQMDNTLFDSEGQIDSEDIYCAKCHSKDVFTDNDIILCDGMCVRAFHQNCLNPPLLTENVPVGDNGWLCPACECKIDCIKLLTEFQGSNMELMDTWEKVFPEVAEIRDGDNDDGCLASGESKQSATSAANSETVTKFGEEFPADLDLDLKQENEELLGKRKIEKLNYKKFHDETYGKSSSDSSSTDNENFSETYDTSDDDWHAWAGTRTPRKRKNKRKRYARRYKNHQKSNRNTYNQDHPGLHSTAKKSSASLFRKIYSTAKQKLHENFQENQYPSKEEKESLAQELGIDYVQVSNWFNAARHKAHHGIYASPSKVMMADDVNAETPTSDKHGELRSILPEAPAKEGSIINETDMVASPCSFPMPNVVNSYIITGTGSINETNMSAPPSSFQVPNGINSNAGNASTNEIESISSFAMPSMVNSYVGAGISGITEIGMGTSSPSSIPMPNTASSCVGTVAISINEQPNKRDAKEKAHLQIPLKEGTSLSQIDIKRQQAIARELKKMKQGR